MHLYHEGKITAEVACEFADSASNVKVEMRTADAGKKVAAMGEGLSPSLVPMAEEE